MEWTIGFDAEFYPEYKALPIEVQDELLARTRWIEQFGPRTGRPWVDTLKGSHFVNMKELRIRRGRWGMAGRLRLRSHAKGHPACRPR
jgi:hypothetical protein